MFDSEDFRHPQNQCMNDDIAIELSNCMFVSFAESLPLFFFYHMKGNYWK